MNKNNFDIVMPGFLFCDLIFLGLPDMPKLGEEIYSKELHISPGGVYITAVAMERLGINVGLIADLGNDIFSKFILQELHAEKIPTNLIRNHPCPLPTITAALSFPEDRAFITYMEGINNINQFLDISLNNHSAKHLHLPGLKEAFASKSLIREAKRRGMTISLDCQWHPDLMMLPETWEILKDTQIFLPNEKEALFLTKTNSPEKALEILRQKVDSTIIKLGSAGSIGFDKNNELIKVPALPVTVVDTTGAGDSFNAGFLFAFLNNLPLEKSMAYGNICGGLSVSKVGGSTAVPTIEQLLEKLKYYS